MGIVEVFVFEDQDGTEETWSTFNAQEAKAYAQQHGFLCRALIYEYADSEPVWDYRPDHLQGPSGEFVSDEKGVV